MRIYSVAERITRVLYINLLWVFFTVIGLIVFGLFPATAAMFAVTRKWSQGETDIPIFKTFWQVYKKDFLQTNLLGYFMAIIGVVLYIDLRFFQSSNTLVLKLFSFIMIVLFVVYLASILYIFPVFVHYKLKTLQYMKVSVILAIGRPLQTILMGLVGLFVFALFKAVPILAIYFGGGLFSYCIMKIAIRSFLNDPLKVE
ncbi:YesL family protein [Bacillus kwashiorkori]|uniref:YesL family protein n=1 Tax=Bacillus kwashiorkori TaxID=1522318 RepID=UPI001319FA0B|nr:YesL family protein [Bacillus kwashiorkori]